MSPEDRRLRNHLRAKARQLGARQDKYGSLEIYHLIQECAYEHWHRMLFARFLAENGLLIEPESDVAISLDECKELAEGEGLDLWTLASRFAQQMLPQIFRPDDPVLRVAFAHEHQLKLENELSGLETDIFTASDALGWVYQFWQAKRKKEVNDSGIKIGADELPAVTQLFTEPYMVEFLIHNTLGAWHAGKMLSANPELAEKAQSEDELRKAVSLPGVSWDYLRFIRTDEGKGPWRPAAGVFEGWPQKASELKIIDPCCGSGHFLVSLFKHLIPLLMSEEGISARKAVDLALLNILYALEIDERCTQISAFSLALAAWTYPDTQGYRLLPDLHIACSGISVGSKFDDWINLANGNDKLIEGLRRIYTLFKEAPTLGSLINPSHFIEDLFTSGFKELKPILAQALLKGQSKNEAQYYKLNEIGVSAKGITIASEILTYQYDLVITNVPYLVRGKQNDILKEFCGEHFSEGKADLAISMILRCFELAGKKGTVAAVIIQYWLFLATYKKLRKKLLDYKSWNFVARLGTNAFETISGEVVNVALTIISNIPPVNTSLFSGIEMESANTISKKQIYLKNGEIDSLNQFDQLKNPEYRILLKEIVGYDRLSDVAVVSEGLHTGDYPRFGRKFWEVSKIGDGWALQQAAPIKNTAYGGREHILFWENGCGELTKFVRERLGYKSITMWIKGHSVWGRQGIAISAMSNLRATLYTGEIFTHGAIVIIPKDPQYMQAIWAYVSNEEFNKNVRALDKKVCVATASIQNVFFDLKHWLKVSKDIEPISEFKCIDPCQWTFEGDPTSSTIPLQVSTCLLLGYKWPHQTFINDKFPIKDDSIVCIPSIRGQESGAERLHNMLVSTFSKDWFQTKEQELIASTGSTANDLDEWLRNEFFLQHCKLFHHRPFIWHIWDGRKRDGFHALVNYHKLAEGGGKGKKLLENLTYSYLGDWINRQKDGVKRNEDGAEDRLAAAVELQKRLIAILEGEPPFDIFVRWKPVERQPVGWNPDINDGVRINIRPFMASDIPGGKSGAGILRWKPNINWSKDRGKEPDRSKEQFPWFWKNGEFTGDRINDVHLANSEKLKARERAAGDPEVDINV